MKGRKEERERARKGFSQSVKGDERRTGESITPRVNEIITAEQKARKLKMCTSCLHGVCDYHEVYERAFSHGK